MGGPFQSSLCLFLGQESLFTTFWTYFLLILGFGELFTCIFGLTSIFWLYFGMKRAFLEHFGLFVPVWGLGGPFRSLFGLLLDQKGLLEPESVSNGYNVRRLLVSDITPSLQIHNEL